jgi:spore germination protein GerM
VARRRTAVKSKPKGARVVVIFWLVFIIVIICVIIVKAPAIKKNFDIFITDMNKPSGDLTPGITHPETEDEILTTENPAVTVVIEPSAPKPAVTEEPKPQTPEPARTQPPQSERPADVTQTRPQTPAQTRDRAVYFTNVGSDGQILQSRVTRRIPVSDSPMQDALNVLLTGPTAEELSRGILNLIPKNTRILSATVRGSTAYISFSEDFLFNTFGVEGYVAQLRQIVWTVTEFQNVKDVQILIEGRRMDYLGEGIWIGSPISRQSF